MERLFSYVVRGIKEEIPIEILRYAFQPNESVDIYGNTLYANLDSMIELHVLKRSLYLDVSIISQVEEHICLDGLGKVPTSDNSFTVHIPKEMTGGRAILDCPIIYLGAAGMGGLGLASSEGASYVNRMITKMLEQSGPGTIASTTDVDVVAPNTLHVRYPFSGPGTMYAAVQLEADDSLSHIKPHAYEKFRLLAITKAKVLVRTILRTKLADGSIQRGQTFGIYKEIVDEYSGEDANYRSLLREWRRTENYLDKRAKQNLIRDLLPK